LEFDEAKTYQEIRLECKLLKKQQNFKSDDKKICVRNPISTVYETIDTQNYIIK
jgi:hypothetical protein